MESKSNPGASPLDVLTRMDRLVALSMVGQHTLAERLGINVTDLTCLGFILGAKEEALTAGRLAELAGITTGAVTGVVNRLESAGYARRVPDPHDRRRIRIVPEGDPATRIVAAYEPAYRRLVELFESYRPDELAAISDWLTRAADAMRISLAEIRESPAP
ncbi:MarR family transcriptional regulator [Streptosporangium sp. NBC_01755]|uniref:MarR family winged helix-turn-helix transcriptional regulator n=1 Tax=Streptosporangium sp. NBC_01755 TaxID=2975949 RepID=UPI002DD8C5DA|nr:MarR family transcriptional regulator [Streptosporangium sp. NBC_01755]WSC97259.1 MarR family transcriptional regulator [Streptosporangium sp. NBC_01755]